jgi:hypothetical protein
MRDYFRYLKKIHWWALVIALLIWATYFATLKFMTISPPWLNPNNALDGSSPALDETYFCPGKSGMWWCTKEEAIYRYIIQLPGDIMLAFAWPTISLVVSLLYTLRMSEPERTQELMRWFGLDDFIKSPYIMVPLIYWILVSLEYLFSFPDSKSKAED